MSMILDTALIKIRYRSAARSYGFHDKRLVASHIVSLGICVPFPGDLAEYEPVVNSCIVSLFCFRICTVLGVVVIEDEVYRVFNKLIGSVLIRSVPTGFVIFEVLGLPLFWREMWTVVL